MGDKASGGGANVYDYYGTIAGAVCLGVVQELIAVIVDSVEVWPKAPAWTLGQTVGLNELRSFNGRTWKCLQGHSTTNNASPALASPYWQAYSLARNPLVNNGDWDQISIAGYGTFIIYWGTETQRAPAVLLETGNDLREGHPDYKGLCYVILKDFLFGRERVSAPNVEVVVGRAPAQSVVTDQNGRFPASLGDGQANVVATIAEVLTSDLGLGLPTARLAIPTFQAAAEKLDAQADLFAASPFIDHQTPLRSWMSEMEALADVWLRFNPATEQVEAGHWEHGVAPHQFTSLSVDDLTEMPQFESEGWQAAKTRGVIQFFDRARAFKQSSDSAEEARAYAVLGEHRQLSLQRPAITRRAQALAHAAEALRTAGSPQLTAAISVRREKARAIRPGDWVKLDIDLEPGGTQAQQFFRVLSKTTPRRGPCKLSLQADTALAPITYAHGETGTQEPDPVIAPITRARILEAPVALANYQAGQVIALVQRPSQTLTGFQVYFTDDSAGSYQFLGNARAFALYATLRADLSAGSDGPVQIAVADQAESSLLGETPSTLTAKDDDLLAILIQVANGQVAEDSSRYSIIEVCSVSAIANPAPGSYDLSVLRARKKSARQAFAVATTEVWLIHRSQLAPVSHALFEELRQNRIAGVTPALGYFKLAPFNQADALDLDLCSAIAFQWPPCSAAGPFLELTAPSVEPASVTDPYPKTVAFTGTWSDPNGDIVAWRISIKNQGGTEELIGEHNFPPAESVAFSEVATLSEPGAYSVYLRAWDVSGLKTERVVAINATGTTPKAAMPQIWFGDFRIATSTCKTVFGPLTLKCATSGATIRFRYRCVEYGNFTAWQTYSETNRPWSTPYANNAQVANYYLEAKAEKNGFTPSDVRALTIEHSIPYEPYSGGG